MKFTATLYLQISDRLVEKAAQRVDLETMGRLLGRANRLWHRAWRLEPPTSEWLTPSEISRLRQNDKVARLIFRKSFVAQQQKWSEMSAHQRE